MGEGSHSYRIKGKYYIVSAIPGAHVPMKCARADKLTGPWEVTTISEEESLGIGQGYRPKDNRRQNPPFELNPPDPSERLSLDLHPPESAVRTESAGSQRAPQPRLAPGRDHRNAVGRMVG